MISNGAVYSSTICVIICTLMIMLINSGSCHNLKYNMSHGERVTDNNVTTSHSL